MNSTAIPWELFYPVLYNLAYGIPVSLVLIAGIVLAFKRWSRHPKVSALVLVAALLTIFNIIVFPLFNGLLTIWLIGRDWKYEEITKLMAVIHIVAAVMSAIIGVLWLMAAFGGRGQQNESLKRAESDE